jgi:formylmethanofuran dehydrogenase subunit B
MTQGPYPVVLTKDWTYQTATGDVTIPAGITGIAVSGETDNLDTVVVKFPHLAWALEIAHAALQPHYNASRGWLTGAT